MEHVHKEQIKSHHGEEWEDAQAGAEASPGDAHVQGDPVNKPEEHEKKTSNRKSDTHSFPTSVTSNRLSSVCQTCLISLPKYIYAFHCTAINVATIDL